MSTCNEPHHTQHDHQHGSNCGHTAILHDGHVDARWGVSSIRLGIARKSASSASLSVFPLCNAMKAACAAAECTSIAGRHSGRAGRGASGEPDAGRQAERNHAANRDNDNAPLVAEAGAATKRRREQDAHVKQLQTALNRALADHARAEAERDALRTTATTQAAEVAQAREARESLTADLAKLAAQFDAQQQLLVDYRMGRRLNPSPFHVYSLTSSR